MKNKRRGIRSGSIRRSLAVILAVGMVVSSALSLVTPISAEAAEGRSVVVEAEDCTYSDNMWSGNGDGNFTQVSGGTALRNPGAECTISGSVVLEAAGAYYVRVYVGSLVGNSGSDKITIDGLAYKLIIPEKTAPGWYAAELRDESVGNPAGAIQLEAGEHTFTITSQSSWCYYDKIEFSTEPLPAPPSLTLYGECGSAANGFFELGGTGLFTGGLSDRAVLRLTEDNTFTYTLNIPEAGNYKITARTAGKNSDSGTASLTVNGNAYPVNVTDSGVAENIPLTETTVAESVSLEAGILTMTLARGTAAWCYFDSFIFTKLSDPDPTPTPTPTPEPTPTPTPELTPTPNPVEDPFSAVEAEDCTYSGSLASGNGDGNFTQVSGGSALRNQGAEGTISGRVVLGEAGNYYVRVYVGSRMDNSGIDSITIDGGSAYKLIIPEKTAPGWYIAGLREETTSIPAGPISLEAGEHTFVITSKSVWCYYDKIEFSTEAIEEPAMPPLKVDADGGKAANSSFTLAAEGLFAGEISGRTALRLTGENTFTYTLNVSEAGNYKITARTAGKNNDSGSADLTVNGNVYSVNVAASGASDNIPLTETTVAESVALEKGDTTITLSTGTAQWCYFDSFTFTKLGDPDPTPTPTPTPDPTPTPTPTPTPDPVEDPFSAVEAEDCTYSGSLMSGNGDGNFTQVSGGSALRNQGSAGTISGRVVLGEAAEYYVHVYVGSRTDNSGSDSITIDGGASYQLMVPEGTAPGWYIAQLQDETDGSPAGPISLEAGEHTFVITSKSAWCYYDKIEFATEAIEEPAMPPLKVDADRGKAANSSFALAAEGLFAGEISGRTALRLTEENTFTYTPNIPEAGNYKITARTAGKSNDSGSAQLRINAETYPVNVTASGVASAIPLTETTVAESVALEAGTLTMTLARGTAAWCYIDSFTFTKLETDPDPTPTPTPDPTPTPTPTPGPDPTPTPPVEEPFSTIEAENCTYTGSMAAGDGDGNFTQVSGGAALRNQGAEGTISGRVLLEEAGDYYVRVYVGSRTDNSGSDSITIDGGPVYRLLVPAGTVPGWYAAGLRDESTGNPVGSISLEAGEHSFEITSRSAWCYYDKIEFSMEPAEESEVPELTLFADRGIASNNQFELASEGLFAGGISDSTVLRLTGENTFSYILDVPESGNYKIKAWTAGKNSDSGSARLTVNGKLYPLEVTASGVDNNIPLTETTVVESVALEAGKAAITLATGTANWCYFDKFTFEKTERSPDPTPGPGEESFSTVEAEKCAYSGNLASGDGDGNFEQVSGGAALRNQGAEGAITGRVVLETAGEYYVQVYVGSRIGNSGSDSITIDGGPAYRLILPEGTAPGWYAAGLREEATGNLAGAIPLEAGEHTFVITSRSAWCYYDKIVFSADSVEEPTMPTLTLFADRGTAANSSFELGGAGLFAGEISDSAVLRLTGDNTFTYRLSVPEAGNYRITARTAGKNNDSGIANLILDGEAYPVSVKAGGVDSEIPLTETTVTESVYLEAGEHTVQLTTGTAVWCYFDSFVLMKTEDEKPSSGQTLVLNASEGRIAALEGGSPIAGFSDGDGNFVQEEGRTYLRLWSGSATDMTRISYDCRVPKDGTYKVIVRMGTIGQDCGRNRLVINGTTYYFTTPVRESVTRMAGMQRDGLVLVDSGIQWYDLELTDRYGNLTGALPLGEGRAKVQLMHQGGTGAEWCYLDSIQFVPSNRKGDPVNTLKTEAEAGWFLTGKGSGGIYTTGDSNFTASGGMALRMMGEKAEVEYRLTVPERGWYTPYVTVSSREGDSGRDRLRVGDTEYYLNIPAGIAPDKKEITWQMEDGSRVPPVWLEQGECTLTLAYDSAAWCYYDTLELRETKVPDLDELKAAIDRLPGPDHITLADEADFEAVYKDMEQYVYMAELYGWEKLDEPRRGKMLLNRARLAALRADPEAPGGRYQYEWEDGIPGGNTAIVGEGGAMGSADGGAYVYLFDGNLTLYFYAPRTGRYHMYFKSGVDNPEAGDKCDTVILNGGSNLLYTAAGHVGEWQISCMGKERYVNGQLAPWPPAGGYWLNAGWNAIVLQANWGYACYDSFYIEPADHYLDDGWYYVFEVEELTEGLPTWDQVTLEDYDRVWKVFQAYQTLSDDEKTYVKNRDKLLMTLARLDAMRHLPDAPEGTFWYELEYSRLYGNTATGMDEDAYGGYTGTGYAYLFDASMRCEVYVPATRTYDIYIRSSRESQGDKCDFVQVNGEEYLTAVSAGPRQWQLSPVGLEHYDKGKIKPVMPVGGIWLYGGWNQVDISANWGYCAYDALVVMPGTGSPAVKAGGAPYSRDALLQEAYIGPGWPVASEDITWHAMARGETSMAGAPREEMALEVELAEDKKEKTGFWHSLLWKILLTTALTALVVAAGFLIRGIRRKKGGEET